MTRPGLIQWEAVVSHYSHEPLIIYLAKLLVGQIERCEVELPAAIIARKQDLFAALWEWEKAEFAKERGET